VQTGLAALEVLVPEDILWISLTRDVGPLTLLLDIAPRPG
jgi:hypothetical protein